MVAALTDRLDNVAARGKRWSAAGSYWSHMQACFPTLGLQASELTAAARSNAPPETATIRPLVDAHIVGDRLIYAGQALEAVDAQTTLAWRRLRRGTAQTSDIEALTAAGLAFECRPACRNPGDWTLVIAPHRDDAPLAVGGIMAGSKTAVMVLNLFTVSGWLGEGFGARTIEHVTALRAAEEELSSAVLGARSVSAGLWEIDLRAFARRALDGYPVRDDFRFRPDPALRTTAEGEAIRDAILSLTKALRPKRVLAPLAVGEHADHVSTKDAVAAVRDELGDDVRVEWYEDQPYSTYDGADPAAHAGEHLEPYVVDVTDQFEAKIQAIAAHRSQFSRDENEARLRAYANRVASQAGLPNRVAERLWREAR